MGLLRGLLGARNLLLVIFVPLLLLPLPVLHPSSEAACAYVLIVTAVYWVSEAVPLGAAALVPAFLYPFFGVLRSSEVAAEYFKNTTLLLVGVICVAAAVEKWNLHKRIALRMVLMAGAKPGMLLLCFMCCTTMLSMWLSNTSTTAMVMPIVEAVLQELVSAEEEQLVAGNSSAEEAEPISLDVNNSQPSLELIFVNEDPSTADFASLMQNKNLNGVPTVTNPVKTANPQGKKQHRSQEKPLVLIPGPRNQELNRKYKSQHDQMICKCLSLSISYAATIGGLTTIIGTSTSLIFLEHFNNQYPAAEVVNFGTWFLFSFPISLIMLVVSWFWMHWLFLGCNFRETCSLSKKKKTKREELSEKRIQEEYEKLGAISYPEMVTGFFFILMTVLWFTREPGFVPGWDSFFEKKGYRTDATVSVFLGFLLFLIPAKKPCFGKKSDGQSQEPSLGTEPIITWKDFQKTMPWEIVILVGGGYALASGSKSSGLSTWIGHQMLSLSGLPPWAVTLLACILVSIVTEFVSNPATITIFLPILCSLSETLHINPLYTLIPVTMCISFAVMLPVGNPPNAIVFSYGHCQIKDMAALEAAMAKRSTHSSLLGSQLDSHKMEADGESWPRGQCHWPSNRDGGHQHMGS
ncbi:solute carrier family 13 member 4 isoform X1 [Canis lupus familiaris]|uniref:solute carrier family 13 member 4 isoform X1 n=2 Tax=Canis lupus familiaris TaxID=9615 RepID=UPI0015F15360|nr:solute carrier family 13 member 4 isoform X1 [Canis lupus familiaris]XP_038415377.1 solute carrier family 13 member 4 isoform X1 [Canis lupus familiaris]XP_038545079.1 solute carrier family 13 member 4 isoform X1 [Canis lupus familiaris]